MTRLRVVAPAKVNLHLQVLGRRPDGFHELRTLLQSIDLSDELEAESAGDDASADLGIRRIRVHEKNAWMLRSHLE